MVVMGLLMLICANPVWAQDSVCAQKKPFVSDILIEMETPDPHYDFSRDLAYLNNDGGKSAEEWLKKNNMQGVWSSKHMQTAGLASGGWGVYYEYTIDPEPLDQYWAYACLYVKELKIRMMFRTIIMIPKEYPKGSCAFNLIHTHELKHFNVNKMVAQKTAERLRQDMPQILADLEKEHVGSDNIHPHSDRMKESIRGIVDVYFQQVMGEEMEKLNHFVDTPEEYGSFGVEMRKCGVYNASLEETPSGQNQKKEPRKRTKERINLYNKTLPQ